MKPSLIAPDSGRNQPKPVPGGQVTDRATLAAIAREAMIERGLEPDFPLAAQKEFARLGMAKSPERNGVLIFVTPRTRKFAVIGDAGVHAKCGDVFWQELAQAMTGYFSKSEFTEGIAHGVRKAGELLAEHFPRP